MALNNNIFCPSNPAKLLDALWSLLSLNNSNDYSDVLIFLPSRRAVRSVEKMIVQKCGNSVILPELVPLGDGSDEDEFEQKQDTVSSFERSIVLAKLLSPIMKNLSSALPLALDLVRTQDYMENEGIDFKSINWTHVVDEKYSEHFMQKAQILKIMSDVLPDVFVGRITSTKQRNTDIRNWVNHFENRKKIIVCGSTASVPATSDLMTEIATKENGYIILPGKISGSTDDFLLSTNPYYSEYKFLVKIGATPSDVKVIDVGDSDIDFFNIAFGNSGEKKGKCNARLIECARESEEAECVAQIALNALGNKQSILIITPDAAGNQRIAEAFAARGLSADFSGGISGAMTRAGRAILNMFDDFIEKNDNSFIKKYESNDFNLLNTIIYFVENNLELLNPRFEIDSPETIEIFTAISDLSDILINHDIIPTLSDIRCLVLNCLSGVSIRPTMTDEPQIAVLGTIESRMQTADVVILTGLNEGMFPAIGYENPWLPRHVSEKLGLPSANRKVSLMALDFINLSCAKNVYWLRSKTAGSSQTTESRFLSRVDVAQNGIYKDNKIPNTVREYNNIPYIPIDNSPPAPPADRTDVYVTELELLIHNPFAFYVRHILRLYPSDDYWKEPDSRDFGNLVHGVIERADGMSISEIVYALDCAARTKLPSESILFHFWHKRFLEIAPKVFEVLSNSKGALIETPGSASIAGRRVRARADRIWPGNVMDIKTGSAPSKKQLLLGNMPQLPLEAFIMQNNGFPINAYKNAEVPVIQFLQLKNNDVRLIEYSGDDAQKMIDAAIAKVSQLFGMYSKDGVAYKYYETSDAKYKAYDDLARVYD